MTSPSLNFESSAFSELFISRAIIINHKRIDVRRFGQQHLSIFSTHGTIHSSNQRRICGKREQKVCSTVRKKTFNLLLNFAPIKKLLSFTNVKNSLTSYNQFRHAIECTQCSLCRSSFDEEKKCVRKSSHIHVFIPRMELNFFGFWDMY